MTKSAPRARRWPDILIGMLVLLLLVGFGLLLLRPDTRTAGVTATPAPAAETTTTTATTEPSSIPAAPSGTTNTAPAGDQATGTPDGAAGTTTEPPTIAAAPVEATPPISSTPPTAQTTEAAPEASATAPETETPAAGSATPRSGGAVATSESRVPLRSDYRITLGTFSTEQAAGNAAAPVSALGYTVYPIDLGSQVVAQVGPFSDETTARQALADIQRAYPGALLYPPRNRSLTQGSSAGADSAASGRTTETTPVSSTPAPSTPAAAPSGPTYLQVGAFDRVDSAQKLVQRLRDLGYNPTVNAPEGKKVTVLVGPYTGAAVTRTETRLSENGLDHFRVR
ncbi:SPOR domain-containing protein [Deinococcus yunweiensis]|uniref:SPOR domain-containing protein n=1 Tax=Deinococcus yunweiensis TaxID=367282 RepID=UPI00398E358A